MFNFNVIEKATGIKKYEYTSEYAIELVQWPFSLYDHIAEELDPTHTPQLSETIWTKLEFLTRFTTGERIAIRSAAKTDPVVEDFMALLNIAEFVSNTDPNIRPALDYLTSLTILGAGRAEKILGVN